MVLKLVLHVLQVVIRTKQDNLPVLVVLLKPTKMQQGKVVVRIAPIQTLIIVQMQPHVRHHVIVTTAVIPLTMGAIDVITTIESSVQERINVVVIPQVPTVSIDGIGTVPKPVLMVVTLELHVTTLLVVQPGTFCTLTSVRVKPVVQVTIVPIHARLSVQPVRTVLVARLLAPTVPTERTNRKLARPALRLVSPVLQDITAPIPKQPPNVRQVRTAQVVRPLVQSVPKGSTRIIQVKLLVSVVPLVHTAALWEQLLA